ncbi:GHKL domain-containing protein [Macrococcus capreoli]|uniref:sensor histidine kinase n=1 Tax=Macrococcus capreoli TaxID=2982690 RepID=UPI003EE534B4
MTDFTPLESIFFIAFQCICFSIAAAMIGNFKYKKQDVIQLILLFFIPAIILFFIFKSLAIIYFIVYYTFFHRHQSWIFNGLVVLVTIFIAVISDHVAALVTIFLFGEKFFYHDDYILYFITFLCLMMLLPWLVRKLYDYIKDFQILYTDKKFINLLVSYLAISIFLIYITRPDHALNKSDYITFVSIYIAYFVISFIMIILLARAFYQKLLLNIKNKENRDYFEYTKELEQTNTAMRKFKHDYVNILTTMSGYIYEDDMEGLRNYFDQYIVPLKENIDYQQYQLFGMDKVNIVPLKGLLTTKIIATQEGKIALKIDIADEINEDDIQMDIIDYCRMMGIVWDNAIEASEEVENSEIQAALMKTKESLIFVISNTCNQSMPSIAELYQENYSSKSGERGLGLSNLNEISKKYSNVFLDTSIQAHTFIQKIEILFSYEEP